MIKQKQHFFIPINFANGHSVDWGTKFLTGSSSFEPDVALCSHCSVSVIYRYRSNTEAVLFACLSSGWATTTGRLRDPKVGNSIKCLSQEQAMCYRNGRQTKVSQPIDYYPGALPTGSPRRRWS